jgi:ubiquinone/menaquinone biosynthesis C-methylase UbiE
MPNPLDRFSDRAADYDAARPSYPAAAINAVLAGADPSSLRIADIGAGTGIFSRLLTERGCAVIAIEPNDAMRTMGASRGGGIDWHDNTGERTGLDAASVDGVVCAQAFHWVDRSAALDEFVRIIDPDSPLHRIALLWNVRDAASPVMQAYCGIMERYAVDPPTSPWFEDVGSPLESHPRLTGARIERFRNEQSLDESGLLRRAASASYFPKTGDARAKAEAELRAVFAAHAVDGRIRSDYHTEVHLAEVIG